MATLKFTFPFLCFVGCLFFIVSRINCKLDRQDDHWPFPFLLKKNWEPLGAACVTKPRHEGTVGGVSPLQMIAAGVRRLPHFSIGVESISDI